MMLNVAIIGCGFIGSAMKNWIDNNNPNVNVLVSDPPKGINDDISKCDAYFVSIHIPTENDGSQDLTTLISIISKLPENKPIWIRTTILPGTTKSISEKTHRMVYHMPEFLSERTYIEDFNRQSMIFTGDIELLMKIFPGKKHIVMSSEEAELAKYAHNCFGALKVTYFNCIYDICKKNNLDYENVRNGILNSSYINDAHTQVPGPDGKLGYGGKCFPKDVNAFSNFLKSQHIGKILDVVKDLNNIFRPV